MIEPGETSAGPRPLTMKVALNRSMTDARRGIVRVHPVVLHMLRVGAWDALSITGARSTGALAAAAPPDIGHDLILMDDVTCENAGVSGDATVEVAPAPARPAATVTFGGVPAGLPQLDMAAVRFAMLGKLLTPGDRVSLLPQDFFRPGETTSEEEMEGLLHTLSSAWGDDWKTSLLHVIGTQPAGLVRATMQTVYLWDDSSPLAVAGRPYASARRSEDLPGLEHQIKALREALELSFFHKDLLLRLGASPQLGVFVSGPAGSGKTALVHSVATDLGINVVHRWAPAIARHTPEKAGAELGEALAEAEVASPAVLLIEDVEALAPAREANPAASFLLEVIAGAIGRGKAAVVCTSARPDATSADLTAPGRLDLEIEVTLPKKDDRRRILEVHTHAVPLAPDVNLDEVARGTPGFVAADLISLCKEAALEAAERSARGGETPVVTRADFTHALDVVKPSAMGDASIEVADVTFEDVGNMDDVKKELTESVVWPLRYPESFSRLGVDPPRGVLLFGPPGCGKTFLVKALSHEAEANFLAVKGAELLSKWVGESEAAVRELFRRARGAAPALIFLDEVDALAPTRGSSHDSGATDRVVAQLLTELDGIEELYDVFVIAATNRPDLIDPAMLRPGRLERRVYVPPPDAEARSEILRVVTRKMPLEQGFDAKVLGADCEGFSAADLEALARAAAMIAMREDLHAPLIKPQHFAAARAATRPSLTTGQVERLTRWAAENVAV